MPATDPVEERTARLQQWLPNAIRDTERLGQAIDNAWDTLQLIAKKKPRDPKDRQALEQIAQQAERAAKVLQSYRRQIESYNAYMINAAGKAIPEDEAWDRIWDNEEPYADMLWTETAAIITARCARELASKIRAGVGRRPQIAAL